MIPQGRTAERIAKEHGVGTKTVERSEKFAKGLDEAYPIIIWNKTIIDGHNRYEICKFHGIEDVPVVEKHYLSKEEAIAAVYALQIGRRNLTPEQIKYCLGKQYEAMKLAHGETRTGKRDVETGRFVQSAQNEHNGMSGKTADRIASEHGVSGAANWRIASEYSESNNKSQKSRFRKSRWVEFQNQNRNRQRNGIHTSRSIRLSANGKHPEVIKQVLADAEANGVCTDRH